MTKKPPPKTSTMQQRKYSIFSSSGDSGSDSDSTGYVDVGRENRLRKKREVEGLRTQTAHQQSKDLRQKLQVDTYELDSSSDFSRLDYDRMQVVTSHSNIQVDAKIK